MKQHYVHVHVHVTVHVLYMCTCTYVYVCDVSTSVYSNTLTDKQTNKQTL